MSDHPSSEPAVTAPGFEAEPRPQGETGAAEPNLTPPPGCWLIPEKLPDYPDRKFGNHLNQFAPLHPENNGWLWPDQVRAGDVVVVVGEAGAGKSTLMADWIARVTSGTPFPGCGPEQAPPAGDVVVFNGRDDFARKVIPGIAAAGGDVVGQLEEHLAGAIDPVDIPPGRRWPASSGETRELPMSTSPGTTS